MSEHIATAYQYAPLSRAYREIRLLRVLPPKYILDSSTDSIETELFLIDLDSDELPQYHAISYTWGSAEGQIRPIVVDNASMVIGVNLDNALRRVRHHGQSVYVWADAVCINQSDLEERGSQVALMHDIYSKADVVNVWLGLENNKTNEATKFIETALAQKDSLEAFYSTFTDAELWEKMRLVKDIFERPYWDRMWVVQEYMVGKATLVFLGSSTLTASELRTFQNTCIRSQELSRRFLLSTERNLAIHGWTYQTLGQQGPAGIDNMQKVLWEESTLFDTVRHLRGRQTTDPRDMIFAVVSSFPQIEGQSFPVTYDKSTAAVYADFARHQIQMTCRLDCWVALTDQPSNIPGLPSWAIDWTLDVRKHAFLDFVGMDAAHPSVGYNFWNAAGNTIATLTKIEREDPRVLSVRGLRIGTVDDICSDATQLLDATTEEFLCTFEKWCRFVKRLAGTTKTPSLYLSLIRTLSCGYHRTWYVYKNSCCKYFLSVLSTIASKSEQYAHSELFQSFAEYEGVVMSPNPEIQAKITKDDVWWQILRLLICHVMEDRRLFISSKFSTIGVGPQRMQLGDVLCVPLGSAFVMVLRPQPDGTYTMIGPSYVRGFMQAEAIQMEKRGILELEDFVLR